MLGLAPAVARVGATSALVIGYGTGVTAHVLAAVPSVARLKVVELEPSVMQMDSFFVGVNGNVLARPGVRVVINHIGLDENIPGNLGRTNNKIGK